MENNKFDKFYSKKRIKDLLEKLRNHKSGIFLIEPDWYDGLIIHLNNRNLAPAEKEEFDYILSTDPKELKSKSQTQMEPDDQSKAYNSGVNPSKIIAAAKAIKSVFYGIFAVTLLSLLNIFITLKSQNYETIIVTNLLLVVLGLIVLIFVLFQIYDAGENLENSVRKVNENEE